MPRLRIEVDDKLLRDDELREGFLFLASDHNAWNIVKAMLRLMKEGHLDLWLSPQLVRQLKRFALEKRGASGQGITGIVDATLLLWWLEEGAGMNLSVRWEVEFLPDNGGIYRMLLKGGRSEEGIHHNEG